MLWNYHFKLIKSNYVDSGKAYLITIIQQREHSLLFRLERSFYKTFCSQIRTTFVSGNAETRISETKISKEQVVQKPDCFRSIVSKNHLIEAAVCRCSSNSPELMSLFSLFPYDGLLSEFQQFSVYDSGPAFRVSHVHSNE